jgi:PST family polysaccharide transporter
MSVVGRNIVWLLVSQGATWVLTFATLIVVPDLLGVDGFGAWNFAGVYVGYFSALAGLEAGPVIVRSIARDPGSLPTIFMNAVALRTVSVVVMSVAAVGIALAIGLDETLLVLIVIGCVSMLTGHLNQVIASSLAGIHRLARPAMWQALQLYVAGIIGIAVLVAGGSVFAFAAVAAAATTIPLVANWQTLRPYLHERPGVDRSTQRLLLTGALPVLMLTALTQAYGTMDYPMLQWLGGSTAVGWYSVAGKWAGIPFFICTAVVTAYFPRFSELAHTGAVEFANAVNRAVSLVLIVALPFAVALVVTADELIHVFYDAEFLPAIPVLQVMAFQTPLTAINTVLAVALIAADRIRPYLFVAGTAVVLTPLALYFTINALAEGPSHGAVGAALVTTLTEVFIICGAYRLRAPGVLDRATLGRCLRAAGAGAVALGLLWPVPGLSMFVRGPLAIVAYLAAALAFRVVRTDELVDGARNVVSTLRRRSGSAPPETPEQVAE